MTMHGPNGQGHVPDLARRAVPTRGTVAVAAIPAKLDADGTFALNPQGVPNRGDYLDAADLAALIREVVREELGSAVEEIPPTIASSDPYPRVEGRCPACRGSSLFLADGGHVTCARLDCTDPLAAGRLIEIPAPA